MKNPTLIITFFMSMLLNLNAQEATSEEEVLNQEAEARIETKIRAKAKKAGLADIKTEQLLQLVFKRNTDYRKAENNADDEKTAKDVKKETSKVKKAFSRELVKLINKQQFLIIFGDDLKPKAKKKAKKELKVILKKHPLTEVQQKEIYKGVYLYHLYDTMDRLYYYASKNKRRRAKYMLRSKFRKDYQNLMNSYGIEANPVKKANNITFLW